MAINKTQLTHLKEYLQRIQFPGFVGSDGSDAPFPSPTLENLVSIHRLHCMHIPFENLLFVHTTLKGTHRPVDSESLHKRLVLKKRGGMCQEMNALLLHNLKLLGYNAYAGLAAMVVDGTLQPADPPLQGLVTSQHLGSTQQCFGTHQILIVTINGQRYLCDAGAGPKCLAEPVLIRAHDDVDSSGPSQREPPADWLSAGGEHPQFGMRYRIRFGILGSAEPLPSTAVLKHPERDSFVGHYLQYCIKGKWSDMYWFSLTPVTNTVLQAASDYSFRHHPLFTRHMVVSQVVPGGRLLLHDFEFKTRLEGQPTVERKLQSEEERDSVLQESFGLDLSLPAIPL